MNNRKNIYYNETDIFSIKHRGSREASIEGRTIKNRRKEKEKGEEKCGVPKRRARDESERDTQRSGGRTAEWGFGRANEADLRRGERWGYR